MILPQDYLQETDDTEWTFALSKKSLKLLKRLNAMHVKQCKPVNTRITQAFPSKSSSMKPKGEERVISPSPKPKQITLLDFIPKEFWDEADKADPDVQIIEQYLQQIAKAIAGHE